jgi:C4-dicarboxylate-specific signal transduction histidine kinase
VRGDRVQLQQVVLNLVLNGLEAMREPGADERTLVIRATREGGWLEAANNVHGGATFHVTLPVSTEGKS